MLTEEPFITIEQLLKRWPGKPYNEIGAEIADLFDENSNPFQIMFPYPHLRRGVERLNPNTGNIVWDVELLGNAPYGINGEFDLEYLCFKVDEIEDYEKKRPEVFYQVVNADDLSEPEDINDYIPAEKARRQRGMSPVEFTSYLRALRNELPLAGLTSEDREYFYGQWGNASIEDIANMLPQISIHQLDWENHLKTLGGLAEMVEPGAGEEAFKARLAEVVADYKAKLKKAEADLAQERTARIKAEEIVKGKSTDKATIGRLKKQIEAWKAVLTWMIPAAIAVAQAGQKTMTRSELWPFVEGAGGPTKSDRNTQFEAWRAALPGDFYDKYDRSGLSQNDDEPIDE